MSRVTDKPGIVAVSVPELSSFWFAVPVIMLNVVLSAIVSTYPFTWDDLVLFRRYPAHELVAVWTGNWDQHGFLTAGYRPLSVWFNHARFTVFGADPVAQHAVNALLLLGAVLTIQRCAMHLGVSPYASMCAALVLLSARYTAYHFVWMTEGMSGLKTLLAAAALLAQLEGRYRTSLLWLALACLVREDALAFAAALILLRRARQPIWYMVGIGTVALATIGLRLACVGSSGNLGLDGFFKGVILSGLVGGVTPTNWLAAGTMVAWGVIVACGLWAMVQERASWPWLGASLGASLMSIANPRVDLQLVPMAFLLIALARALPPRTLPVFVLVGAITGLIGTDAVYETFRPGASTVSFANNYVLTLADGRLTPEVPVQRESTFTPRLENFLVP